MNKTQSCFLELCIIQCDCAGTETLNCDTHLYLCNIELCENSRVTTDIADNWEHVDTHVQMQRMAFENAVSCNVGSLIKKISDLFIRILIRKASCYENIQRIIRLTLMLLIFTSNASRATGAAQQVVWMLLDASMYTTEQLTQQQIRKYYSNSIYCRRESRRQEAEHFFSPNCVSLLLKASHLSFCQQVCNDDSYLKWRCLGLHSHLDTDGKSVSVMSGIYNQTRQVYNVAATFDGKDFAQMYEFVP